MKEISIKGKNYFGFYDKEREASRAIIINDDKILLTYAAKNDIYFLPGGQVEKGETYSDCCAREVKEETGIIVNVKENYLVINEYYENYLFKSYFFECEEAGTCDIHLTSNEEKVMLKAVWMKLEDAYIMFSKHQDYATTNEEKRGIYLREYTALKEFLAK